MKGLVTIIIPVYNEEKFIKTAIFQVAKANTLGYKKEIIIVDDGSKDNTDIVIKKNIKNEKFNKIIIKKIFKKNNKGKGSAIRSALNLATGDLIIIQDADLEYSPKDYPVLLKPFTNKNIDVVYGSRTLGMVKYHNSSSGLIFFIGGQILTILFNILFGTKLTDQPTGYKVFRKRFIKYLIRGPEENGFSYEVAMTSIFVKQKAKIKEVPISYQPRHIKQGKKINFLDFIDSVFVTLKYKFLVK